MTELSSLNALHLIQAATTFQARLSGSMASVHGLSVNEFLLLLHLDQAEPKRLTRVELARRMHVSASTITRMARPMEKTGLLGRQAHERDARLAFVVLTDTGSVKLAEAKATFSSLSGGLFADRWTEDELQQFSSFLHRLVSSRVGFLRPSFGG